MDQQDQLKKQLNAWKETDVKIGFIGRSGVGKSSFINTFRDFTDEDYENPDYAATGSTQTTSTIKEYAFPDPNLRRIKLWDLPGCDTPEFPLTSYAEKIQMDSFDAFVVLTSDRFYTRDIALLKLIKRRNKPYFFARTKMDLVAKDLGEKVARNMPRCWNEKWTAEQANIKRDCMEKLNDDSIDIFLISKKNIVSVGYDTIVSFSDNQRLKAYLIHQLPHLQKEVLLLAVAPYSKKLIEMKVNSLKDRMYIATALSGLCGAIPVPGVSTGVDIAIFENERYYQKKTLGINAEYLEKKANFFGIDKGVLLQQIIDGSSENIVVKRMIKELLGSTDTTIEDIAALNDFNSIILQSSKSALLLSIAQLPEEAAKLAVPIASSVIGATFSAASTFALLKTMLWFHTLAAETFYDVERKIEKEYLNRQA